MYGTFYTHSVYTICLIVVLAFALAALGLAALAFSQRAADRYRPRHAARAFGRTALVLAAPSTSRAVEVWVPNLPAPIRLARPHLLLVPSTRPPVAFPETDAALASFRRNMDSVIAALA